MQDSPRFRPFETALDADRALELLRSAVAGADDGELFPSGGARRGCSSTTGG